MVGEGGEVGCCKVVEGRLRRRRMSEAVGRAGVGLHVGNVLMYPALTGKIKSIFLFSDIFFIFYNNLGGDGTKLQSHL